MLSRSATELTTVKMSLEDAMPASCLSNLGKRAFLCGVDGRVELSRRPEEACESRELMMTYRARPRLVARNGILVRVSEHLTVSLSSRSVTVLSYQNQDTIVAFKGHDQIDHIRAMIGHGSKPSSITNKKTRV
jgi:hypothetical protein